MDPVVTAINLLGGLVTGLVVAVYVTRSARKTDERRWDREDRLRRDELEQARTDRWLDRRREVAVTVAGVAQALTQMAMAHGAGRRIDLDTYFAHLERGFAGVAELRLISEDLHLSGGDLLVAAQEVVTVATTHRRQSLEPSMEAFGAALATYMAAAESDLKR